MHTSNRKKRAFYVVQFIELPYKGIQDYVCVPYTWLIVRRSTDQKAVVAYPNDKDPFVTRDRVQRIESCDEEWSFYVATVKYESDIYRDAELWIATRNDYGPSVEEESKIIKMQSDFTMNKKLTNSAFKRPSVSAPRKQLDNKRSKLNEAAQLSSAISEGFSREPGCSNRHQSIFMPENQSMKCAQTEETAVASSSESSDRVCSKLVEQPKPAQEPQVLKAPSKEMSRRDQELRTDNVLNDELTCGHLPNSLKMASSIYSHMNGARRLVPIGEPVEKTIRFMNINSKLAIDAQNPSHIVNQAGFVSNHLEKQQSSVVTHNHSYDGQRMLEIDENQLKESTENYNQHHRSNSQSIKTKIPSIGKKSTSPTNPLYQDSTPLQQKPSLKNLDDSQQQSRRPKIRIGVSIRPKTNRHLSNLKENQGISKNRPQPILTRVLNSILETLSITHNHYLLSEQPEETSRSENFPVTEKPRPIMDNALQRDEIIVEETGSPYRSVTSDSDDSTEEKEISNKEISGNIELVEPTHKAYRTGIDSRISSVDRPTSKQTSTSKNYQMQPKVVSEQLFYFRTLFTQMESTLRSTCDMYNILRNSIKETAETYKQLVNTIERGDALKNPTNNPSPSSNQTPGVSYSTEERNR